MFNLSEKNSQGAFAYSEHADKACLNCAKILHPFQIPSILGLPPKWLPAADYCDSCTRQKEISREKFEEQKRIDEVFRNSMLTPRFKTRTFENFEVNDQNRKAWETAIDFKINREGNGLLFFGSYGIGKTHLAASIANRLLGEASVLYISCPDLLSEIRESIQRKGNPHRFNIAKTVTLLVLDDIGAEKPSDWVRETLFVLINYRYEHQLCTIFTTNCSLEKLEERLGGRIVSRIAEMCRCIHFEGEDWRVNSKKISA